MAWRRDPFYWSFRSAIPANRGNKWLMYGEHFQPARAEPSLPPVRSVFPPIVMVHGRSVPGAVAFGLFSDIGGGHYSWAAELAEQGHEVYVIELEGMGKSTHPAVMDEVCNANKVPHPIFTPTSPSGGGREMLGVTCTGTQYERQLSNSASDELALDGAILNVRYLRDPMNYDRVKVRLVGYSAGAFVVGPYAAKNPHRVSDLLLVAPTFGPNDPSLPPADGPLKPDGSGDALNTPENLYGYPMYAVSQKMFTDDWEKEIDNTTPASRHQQRDDRIVDVVWNKIWNSDGNSTAFLYEGLRPDISIPVRWQSSAYGQMHRARTYYYWGWNKQLLQNRPVLGSDVPVLIIYGARDSIINTYPAGRFSVTELYNTIAGGASARKILCKIEGTGHSLLWEQRRHVVHRLAAEWCASPGYGAVAPNTIHGRLNGKLVFSDSGVTLEEMAAPTVEPLPEYVDVTRGQAPTG